MVPIGCEKNQFWAKIFNLLSFHRSTKWKNAWKKERFSVRQNQYARVIIQAADEPLWKGVFHSPLPQLEIKLEITVDGKVRLLPVNNCPGPQGDIVLT